VALAINSQMPSNAGFSAGFSPSSPRTFSFTNAAGTVLYAFVGLGNVSNASDTVTFGAVSYGAVPMTSLFEVTSSGSTTGGKLGVFRLLSPPTGANTFSFAWSVSGNAVIDTWAGCITFTGNNTSTPEAQTHSARGTSVTASDTLSGVVSGNIVIACAGAGTTMTAQTQTLDWAANVSPGSTLGNGRASLSTTAGSVTHSYTISASDRWVVGSIEVAAAPDLLGTRTGAGIIG
jgi:ribosomal protein S11